MITVRITSQDPPCGEVGAEGLEPVPFEGWLGMMKVVSELVARTEDTSPELVGFPDPRASRFSRELDARGKGEFAEHVG